MDKKKNESRRKPFRSLAGILLALCLIIAMMPVMAFANEAGDTGSGTDIVSDTGNNDISGENAAGEENAAGAENAKGAGEEDGEDDPESQEPQAGSAAVSSQGLDGAGWADAVYILGVQVTSQNCDDVLGDGKVKYDHNSRTITLNDATLDLAAFDDSAYNENNRVYGISSWRDFNIVLEGTNKIVSSETSFEEDKEYVYGIEADGGLNISGSGSLSISIATDAPDVNKFYGIDSGTRLDVDRSNITVSMNGAGDGSGIYARWNGFGLTGGAKLSVSSTGGGSHAVYDSSYKKSTVEYGSSIEMISDSGAFQFSRLSESLTEGSILVNTEATPDNALEWDKETSLRSYNYVKLLGKEDGDARAAGKVYILGREIKDGVVPRTVPHSGTIEYDSASGTLTLTGATIDLDRFDSGTVGNLVAGIYATSDIRIVLHGNNTIKASNNKYAGGTEYVSGIESWGAMALYGSTEDYLSIELAGNNANNKNIEFCGISSDGGTSVKSISLRVNMGSCGKCTGMYAWKPIMIGGGADVRVNADGNNSKAVNGINSIGDSEITDNSVFEMSSDGIAFNCWTPGASLKKADAVAGMSKDGSGATAWDKSSALYEYKYVKFTGAGDEAWSPEGPERFGDDVRILGKKIDEDNCDDVFGDRTVSFDFDTNTLTLTDAKLDLKDFHHEYDDEPEEESGCNYVTGIDADRPITIVLNGTNRIYSTAESYSAKREYIYGINMEILCGLTIKGPGTLSISFDKNSDSLTYTGIDIPTSLTLDGTALNVDLGGEVGGEGIDAYMADAVKLQNGATASVKATGEKSKALSYMFASDLSIGESSMLELTSDGKAFNYAMLSSAVTEGGALVNEEATADEASAWDKTTRLTAYKYVRFPEKFAHTHTLVHHPAKNASCTEDGNQEYWDCSGCGKFFSDAQGEKEVTDPDELFTPKTGHKYGEWKSISDTEHQRVCEYNENHKDTADHEWDGGKVTKKATLFRKGEKTFTCTVCGATRTKQYSITDAIKDAVGNAAEKIREWIEKIFGGGGSDDPDVLPTELTVTLAQDTFTYNGKVQKPAIESVMAGDEAVEGYSVEYEENSKDVGTYNVTVTFGIEEYSISGTAEYTIEPAEITDVTVNRTSFTYNGVIQKPSVVTVKAGSLKLESSDYKAEYSDSRSSAVGDYSLTVEGKGNFKGSKTVPYSVKKASNPLSVSGKTATVKRKNLKKKAQTVAAASVMDISGAQGSVTYSLVSVSKAKYRKYFSIDAGTGNVTVKKKLRKGTYTLTVNVNAAGNNNYNAASANVVCKIKVK